MGKKMLLLVLASALFVLIDLQGLAADASGGGAQSAPLYPASIKGIKTVYTARMISLGWRNFTVTGDGYKSEANFAALYAIGKKIELKKSVDSLLSKRIPPDPRFIPAGLAPAGYFIVVASDKTMWLVQVERYDYTVEITRLKPATDDVELKLYWQDLEEPGFVAKGPYFYELLDSMKPKKAK